MKQGNFYCLFISKTCLQYCKVIKVNSDKGFFVSAYRPNTTEIVTPFWITNDFFNKCISDVIPIPADLYHKTLVIRRERKLLSKVF